jgi:sarcosine oxidase subunit alpha
MTDPERWKLVGLETLDGSVLPDGAYAVARGPTPTASAT